MKTIRFTDFVISSRRIDFHVVENLNGEIDEESGFFEFSADNVPSGDAICYAFVAMVRSYYDQVYLEQDIHGDTLEHIGEFAGKRVECRSVLPGNYNCVRWGDIALNFSGGFDSLAAYRLLPPKKTKLIALDFGGGFAREENFFKKFEPYTVHTNFRHMRFFRKLEPINWTFMGVGSLLFCEKLSLGYIVFGSILEASTYGFANNAVKNTLVRPFSYMGMKSLYVTQGLTEIGTALAAAKYEPIMMQASLNSLADDGSEKKYRKYTMLRCLNNRFGLNLDLSLPTKPQTQERRIRWGTYFASDFLLLYFIKHLGRDYAHTIMRDIPEAAFALVAELKLAFYEKLNPNYLCSIDEIDIREFYLRKLQEASIEAYDLEDVFEFQAVRKFLGRYHKGLSDYCAIAEKNGLEAAVQFRHTLAILMMNRVDIKTLSKDNKLEVVGCDEVYPVALRTPSYLNNEYGNGFTIIGKSDIMRLKMKCVGNGSVQIRLMGLDMRDERGNRFPLKVIYSSLKINGKEVLVSPIVAWHDEAYEYKFSVSDGMKFDIEVAWLPYHYTAGKIAEVVEKLDGASNRLEYGYFS